MWQKIYCTECKQSAQVELDTRHDQVRINCDKCDMSSIIQLEKDSGRVFKHLFNELKDISEI